MVLPTTCIPVSDPNLHQKAKKIIEEPHVIEDPFKFRTSEKLLAIQVVTGTKLDSFVQPIFDHFSV